MVPTMPSAVIGSARPVSCRRASSNEQENMYPAMATIVLPFILETWCRQGQLVGLHIMPDGVSYKPYVIMYSGSKQGHVSRLRWTDARFTVHMGGFISKL